MIIGYRMFDKHQHADSLSKKSEFYEKLEQKKPAGRKKNDFRS